MQIPSDDPKRKGTWDDAYGSAVVIESGDWGTRLLTDAHVVDGARNVRATVGDTGKPLPVKVVALSDDADDLALLEIAAPRLPAVRLSTETALEPGRAIGVLGYPIPDAFIDEHLRTTVSLYTGRIASMRNGAIEVDVPIIPGESGGPVFAADTGEVIGIAESRFDEERAIGFATPAETVKRFLAAHPLPASERGAAAAATDRRSTAPAESESSPRSH
jgi:S1-C subfamily serine protease